METHSGLIQTILAKRGITEPADVAAFLNPDYELHTHSPFLLNGMDKAVDRLLRAIEADERIAIYADFDCDGIPGAALMSDFFNRIGYSNFEVYLPHRDREGYGFHTEAIALLAGRGVKLIITIDVGTNALAAVGYAQQLGIEVIITDHHELMGALPEAIAVLNPKRPPYPFPDLCGAAVAFKLVQAAVYEGARRNDERFRGIQRGWEKWLLDMVALATISDMVPLVGENRVLALWGLRVLRKSPRPGVIALCNRMRLRKSELTEDDIGFSIAPRLNAASRMGEPDLAFKLLTTQDRAEAQMLAEHLEELNTSRKGAVGAIVRQAKRHVAARFPKEERVVVMGDPQWKPALLGLAANSIMSERGGIVCLWGRDVNGNLKGSCRSDGGVSVVEVFAHADRVLQEYGGHERSGGFSVSHEHVHELHDAFSAAARSSVSKNTPPSSEVDLAITLPDVSGTLFAEVTRLAPFGVGNPKPVFRVGGVIITQMRRFGKESNHVEISLECRTSGARSRAFQFFKSPEDFTLPPAPGAQARVLATLERDSFRGGLALRLLDVLSA